MLLLAAIIFLPDNAGALQTKAPQIRKIDQQLIEAAEKGALDLVDKLILQGANVNARNESGETPLHLATNRKLAELLIAKGADVNAKDDAFKMTPIFNASLEITELLAAKGADLNAQAKDGVTPLCWTVYWNMMDKAKFLIAKGANVNGTPGAKTPLQIAANWGKREFAELLIAKGADVNARDDGGWTALHWAAFEGGPAMAALLIAKGADKNARAKDGAEFFPPSATPLDVAEKVKSADTAAYLRSQGCKRSSEIK
jgi:cytohesin